jgi:hypothetical protein
MDTGSIASVQDGAPERRQASVLSVDDPDVRLAAEALSGLGNPGMSSPSSHLASERYTGRAMSQSPSAAICIFSILPVD